jgi:hypothetical protein
MTPDSPVAMVRCRLDPSRNTSEVRYIPATEFDLWRHLMESKYGRTVEVEAVSVWVPEKPGVWDDGIDGDQLEPVVRLRFEKPGPYGTAIPVVRYLQRESFREAKAALLAHFDLRCRWSLEATPGYFVAAPESVIRGGDSDGDREPPPPY